MIIHLQTWFRTCNRSTEGRLVSLSQCSKDDSQIEIFSLIHSRNVFRVPLQKWKGIQNVIFYIWQVSNIFQLTAYQHHGLCQNALLYYFNSSLPFILIPTPFPFFFFPLAAILVCLTYILDMNASQKNIQCFVVLSLSGFGLHKLYSQILHFLLLNTA